jgi:hypothetical protein
MLRDLLDEIVRRRLWPIPVVALAVAVAAPLLFLKPTPQETAPAAAAAPASSQTGLPARARRLLATSDATATSGPRLARSARDPFKAPARKHAKKKSGASAKDSSSRTAGTTSPSGSGGTGTDGSTPLASGTTSGGGAATTRSITSPSAPSAEPMIDVRFGAHKDSQIWRRIPRLKVFEVDGEDAMVFVKYSPSRDKAIFAVADSTTVHGDIECRNGDGVCYLDIPAGKFVRLTFVTSDGLRVSRRLDVVRINHA